MERKGVVTFKGNPLTLLGPGLKAGDKAPDFTVLDNTLKETRLADFAGKVKVISVTPSLDTPVCDHQARRFNEEAAKLAGPVEVINISMDLPFAAGRFCTTAGIEKVRTFSDHRDASFGNAYGVLVKELRLLARAVFVIDAKDNLSYVEIVPEMTSDVNFEMALKAATSLVAAAGR